MYNLPAIHLVTKSGNDPIYKKKHFVQVMAAAAALVLLIHIPVIYNFLNQFISMFVALYDYETANEISDSFGSNAGGMGQRIFIIYLDI